MAREEQIIIEVEVNAGQSAERLALVQEKIQRLKAANKELRAEQKAINEELRINGTISEQQAKRLVTIADEVATNTASLKELTAVEKMYTAQVQIATQNDRKFGDSITELGAQLAQLKSEYRGLTKAQRESAEGQEMLKNIQRLDQEVKELDYSLGDHQRNVGNYVSALTGLNGNVLKVANLFQGGFRQGLAAATTALKSFAKTLLTTPLGWIAAAVAAAKKAFDALVDGFRRNDDASTALSVAMARLQPIVTAIKDGFAALANVVATVVGWVTKAATAILNHIPAYKQASEAAQELVKAQDQLEDKQREHTINEAKRNREIAALRKKAVSDEKLTAKEREQIYKDIDELSRQNMEEQKKIAEEDYRILKQRAKEKGDTSEAMKNRLTEAYAAMLKAQTDYLTETTRIGSRQAQARKEQAAQEAAAAKAAEQAEKQALEERRRKYEEYQKAKVEAAKKANDELRKLEDLQNKLIEDEGERARVAIRQNYTRQIEDLKARLESEANLNDEARRAINAQIVLLDTQMWKELAEVDDEELKKKAEAEKKMVEDTAKAAADAAKAAADATEAERARLRAVYESQEQTIEINIKERLNAVFGNVAETANIELEAAQTAYDRLVKMDAETKSAMFGTENEYRIAVLDAEAQIMEAREKSAQAQATQAKEVGDTMHAVTGALSDLYEAAAGDSESYERYKKAMAIVDATISLAQTIAAATAASTAGDPYTLAIRIAANVAEVTAQFAAVIKAIKGATVPTAPTFATGGIVPGESWSGDRVEARLNSGEMVINRQDQQRLWELVSGGVPFAGIDYRLLAAAVAEGVEALPAPVLDYSEFTRFEKKVKTVEKIVKL